MYHPATFSSTLRYQVFLGAASASASGLRFRRYSAGLRVRVTGTGTGFLVWRRGRGVAEIDLMYAGAGVQQTAMRGQ